MVNPQKFRQSGYTTIVTLLDIPFIWLGVYAVMNSQWIIFVVCIVASLGMGVFQINALAADYAKWRQDRELNEFKEGSNEDN